MKKYTLALASFVLIFAGCNKHENEKTTTLKEQVHDYFEKQIFQPNWKEVEFQMLNDTKVQISDTQTALIQGNELCEASLNKLLPCIKIKPEQKNIEVSFHILPSGDTIKETLSVNRTDLMIVVRRPNGFPITKVR